MNNKYVDIFKEIVKSYKNGKNEEFEKKLNAIISSEELTDEMNPDEVYKIISSLCGVEVRVSDNFAHDLREAIERLKDKPGVVTRIRECKCCISGEEKSPCQNACPFEAIIFNKNEGKMDVDKDRCINCGTCVNSCEHGSLMDRVEFLPIANLLKEKKPVIAAVAPSIEGQFGRDVSLEKLRAGLKKVGFTDMVEVAFFADMLTLKEATEFNHLIESEEDFMLSSCCCPIWFGMLQKVYRTLIPHVSPSVSPMIASGRVIKKLNPDYKVVFIGPCIAKKGEIRNKDIEGAIDYVLTFQELKAIFEACEIELDSIETVKQQEYASREGRLYGRVGGVSLAVNEAVKRLFPDKADLFTSSEANGMIECKAVLERALKGEVPGRFIEGMGCVGGCVGGPKRIIETEKGRERLNKQAESTEIKVSLDNLVMKEILHRLSIDDVADFKIKDKEKIFERRIE